MKRLIKCLLVFVLFVLNFSVSTQAIECNHMGDGSFDNPYTSFDKEILEYINTNYDNLNSTKERGLSSASTEINNSIQISKSGAYWSYKSGGYTTQSNGSLVYTFIEYIPHSCLADLCAIVLKGNALRTTLNRTIQQNNTSSAVAVLQNAGIDSALTCKILSGVGFLAKVYGGVTNVSNFCAAYENSVLANAHLNKKHLMVVHFKTSYNGSWYLHSRIEEAATRYNPQIPKKEYGIGRFVNQSRFS